MAGADYPLDSGEVHMLRYNGLPRTREGVQAILDRRVAAFVSQLLWTDLPDRSLPGEERVREELSSMLDGALEDGDGYLEAARVLPKNIEACVESGQLVVKFYFEFEGRGEAQEWRYDPLNGDCTRDGFVACEAGLFSLLKVFSEKLGGLDLFHSLSPVLDKQHRKSKYSAFHEALLAARESGSVICDAFYFYKNFSYRSFTDTGVEYPSVLAKLESILFEFDEISLKYAVTLNFSGEIPDEVEEVEHFEKVEYDLIFDRYSYSSSNVTPSSKNKFSFSDLGGARQWFLSYLGGLSPEIEARLECFLFLSDEARLGIFQAKTLVLEKALGIGQETSVDQAIDNVVQLDNHRPALRPGDSAVMRFLKTLRTAAAGFLP